MTEFPGHFFDHDNAVERMGETLDAMLSNQVPAFIIRQAGEDIDQLTEESLSANGWDVIATKRRGEVDVTALKSIRSFGLISRHIEYNGYIHYPDAKCEDGITVRGHDAITGSARVEMRHASLKEVGSPSHRLRVFEPDKKCPMYLTVQNPGDRIMFVVFGGTIGDTIIRPAQHDFARANILQARRFKSRDFIVLPRTE